MVKTIGIPWPQFNEGLTYNDLVSPSNSGLTLIQYYSSNYSSSAPFQGWVQRIYNGQITIDGHIVTDPNTILSAGSKLVYHRLPWMEPKTPFLLEVLYEDDDMIALNKPSGLQVLPGGLFQQRTVLTQLNWHAKTNTNSTRGQDFHPVPVHRLGRGTSGLLLCAKTKCAKARLAAYFADGTSLVRGKREIESEIGVERQITKIYRTLVKGIIETDEVTIDKAIGIMRYPGVAKGLYVALSSGKPALSKVRVLERNLEKGQTLVQEALQFSHMWLPWAGPDTVGKASPNTYSSIPNRVSTLSVCPYLEYCPSHCSFHILYVAGGQPECFDSELVEEAFAEDGGYQRPTKLVPGDCGYHLHVHEVTLSHPTTHEVIKIIAPLPSMLKSVEEAKVLN